MQPMNTYCPRYQWLANRRPLLPVSLVVRAWAGCTLGFPSVYILSMWLFLQNIEPSGSPTAIFCTHKCIHARRPEVIHFFFVSALGWFPRMADTTGPKEGTVGSLTDSSHQLIDRTS
jgi:hypothetical protein